MCGRQWQQRAPFVKFELGFQYKTPGYRTVWRVIRAQQFVRYDGRECCQHFLKFLLFAFVKHYLPNNNPPFKNGILYKPIESSGKRSTQIDRL